LNGFILYPRLISTTGAVSLVQTETSPLRFAVLLDAVAGKILDTFTDRAEAEEFYTDAQNRIREGRPWPDPDAPAVVDVHPSVIVAWAIAKVYAEEQAACVLPCGCYADACYCGQYPTQAEMFAMQAEADALLPEREPMTDAEIIEAEELSNFFGLRRDQS